MILSHKIQLDPTMKQRGYFARAAGTSHVVPDKGPEIRTPLTWQEWDALKRAVRAMRAHEKQVDDQA
jgi:hypothetical protein